MTENKQQPNPQRKLFFGLFVFPLLIAVGMALLLCTVVLLTNEEETPESLITAIKTGSPSKRWQKAFELSNELNHAQSALRNEGVMNEIIHVLHDTVHYDSKTRSYMALALSHFHQPPAIQALYQVVVNDQSEDVQLYALWALGTLGDNSAVPNIIPLVKSEKDQVRKMAVYVLGVLGESQSIPALLPLLEDPVSDVRWNTALSLARLGNDAGLKVLMKMLERKSLVEYNNLPETEIEKVMINALKGLALLKKPQTISVLEKISREDQNLKVRQAALEAIQYIFK